MLDVHIYICICVCICIYDICIYVYMYICVYVYMYTHLQRWPCQDGVWALSRPNLSMEEARDRLQTRTVFQLAKPDQDACGCEQFLGIPTYYSAPASMCSRRQSFLETQACVSMRQPTVTCNRPQQAGSSCALDFSIFDVKVRAANVQIESERLF